MRSDFGVLILTHGRPDNVITYTTLKYHGYTGRIIFVIDNEDRTADKYRENFPDDEIVVFDKKKYADSIDEGNNFDERRTITHARNASFDIAKKAGLKFFIQLDDDYLIFEFKRIKDNLLTGQPVKDLDSVFEQFVKFMEKTPFHSIALSQGGDYIGGAESVNAQTTKILRKCMNSFICSTDPERQFRFVGAMNEDVNTYTTLGSRGYLFGTLTSVSLTQKTTQSQDGGITEMYLRFGTYAKSFTTVMMMPSSVKVAMMNSANPRIHHKINWRRTVPKILSERHKKRQ